MCQRMRDSSRKDKVLISGLPVNREQSQSRLLREGKWAFRRNETCQFSELLVAVSILYMV